MKKIIISVLLLSILTGCSDTEYNVSSMAEKGQIQYFNCNDDVKCDKDTHILYYYYSSGRSSTSYMCPYYSKNGKLCRYEDGKIIEVEE